MGEAYRKQHIVPQAYLNRFGTKKKDYYTIGTRLVPTAKRKVKLFIRPVEEVGFIEKYYDTCVKEDPKYWEHYLDKEFDSLCGQPLDNIVAKITLCASDGKVLNEKDKDVLSRIIISQSVRVPSFVDKFVKDSEGLLEEYKQEFIQSLPSSFESSKQLLEQVVYNVDERKDLVLSAAFDDERFYRFCEVLKQKVWCVFYNNIRSTMPFITNDNPVVYTDMKGSEETMTSIGLANERTVIFYPLTPSILIAIYSPGVFWGRDEEYNCKRRTIDDIKFIVKVNSMVMRQSSIYSFLPEPFFTEVVNFRVDEK